MRPRLLFREWLTIAIFSAFFFPIIIFSILESNHINTLITQSGVENRIYIEGEVLRPGMYTTKEGTTLIEALEMAGLKKSSNLKGVDQEKIVADGERIRVKAQKLLKIRLLYPNGREEEQNVPQGSKIDLIDECVADSQFRTVWKNRRKILKEGDSICLEPIKQL